ncbi:MAG: HAMP domain-containing protein [Treponema sp.]|uniref:methyl-accepting chemotaxis protein n=1 Tax=Treponema sp. TaxID=166 RepID=UPI0025DD61FC|nr:methyl-accepting chemotaxis protein [Treponema sp.]MBQ8678440.1 HAMP domain-containing protein [Treponema sp.]
MGNQKKGLNLFYKIFSGYLIALVAITAIALLLMSNADRFSHDSELIETEILPNTLKAKDLQLHVIQVQQWLTDISATRGAPGYDDGYDEAAEHAKAFGEIIQEFTAFYSSHNDNEKVKELAEMQTAFNGYYDMGKHMAATYIEYGPEEGNKIMEEFDPYAEKISEMVDGFVENISGMLVTRIKGISDDSHNLVILGSVVSGISTVLLIVLSIIISFKITKPIKEFSAVLKDISEGEGDLTRKIEVSSRDEIGEMAEYFNNIFAKIRQLVATVQNQSNMLGSVGSNLSSNMTETAAAINQISANIKSIKSQTINQAASVTETSSTMEQISMGISRLNSLIGEQSSNISQSSSIINSLIQNIDGATKTLIHNTENINRLAETSESGKVALDKITHAIEEVANESRSLMEISSVIQNIASETNLLAMNAAIEAAHAGETGKGFAVVADEVRKLAESSSAQTKTIESALKKITASISVVTAYSTEVVEKFTSIEQEVNNVSNQEERIRSTMEQTSENSKEVLHSITMLNDITQKVQKSSVEMLEGSNQITHEAKNMNTITQEITGGMNEMATGADQITEAVNTVNTLTVDTQNSINALNTEVNKFKV